MGFDLIPDLCAPGVRPDLVENPPIRILVVDDEPLARRAITGALQTTFARPVAADSGESALGSPGRRVRRGVLDVCMPGMDGFAVCPAIHETPPTASPRWFLSRATR